MAASSKTTPAKIPHRVPIAPTWGLLVSSLAKIFQYFQNVDFVLSLGNTGVAEVLNLVFGKAWWVILVALAVWSVWEYQHPTKKPRYPVWINYAVVGIAFCALGFVVAIGLSNSTPVTRIMDNTEFNGQSSGESTIRATIKTARIRGLRDKGETLQLIMRGADDRVDSMSDEHILASQEFSISDADQFVIATSLDSKFVASLREGLEFYLVSLPNKKRRPAKSLADVVELGGRILDKGGMKFKLELNTPLAPGKVTIP